MRLFFARFRALTAPQETPRHGTFPAVLHYPALYVNIAGRGFPPVGYLPYARLLAYVFSLLGVRDVSALPSKSIARELIGFSLPLILSGVLQQLYNWVDAFIVGHVEGELAMGAVGATTAAVNLFLTAIIGFTLGLNVLMAQRHGAGEDERLPRLLGSFSFALGGVFLLIGALGVFFAGELLELLDTTADMLPLSEGYLSIVFTGMPFLAVYNVYSAALRALGDSRAPFLAVAVSSGVNVALDILLVAVIPWGVRGAAIATVISQIAMTVFMVSYAVRKYPTLRFRPARALFRGGQLREGASFGFPPMIQSCVSALGSMLLQSYMNSFGNDTVTAITTAYRVDTIILLPMINLGSAISTLTAQSHGAGDDARAAKILNVGCLLMAAVSLVLTGIIIPTGGYLIAMFGAGETVVGIGSSFFACIAPFYIIYGLSMAVRGHLEGLGRMVYSSAVGIAALALRIAASYALRSVFWNMTIAYAEAFSWVLMLLLYTLKLLLMRRRHK